MLVIAARCAQGVCHRDLKLENILLDDCDPPHIKICDFGYSKVSRPLNARAAMAADALRFS